MRNKIYPDEIEYIHENMNAKSAKEMAEWIGCTRQAVLYHVHKFEGTPYRGKWNKDIIDTIKSMKLKGCKIKYIASEVGLSRTQCYNKIRYLLRKGELNEAV